MTNDLNNLKRFFHWRPILSLVVALTVISTTWTWWPEDDSFMNQAHLGLFVLLSLLAMYNYVMTIMVGPGVLPRNWQPLHRREAQFLQFCKKCDGFKAPRSQHCHQCGRCVKKMDHHCPWINQCVGWSNQAYFVFFLFFYMLSNLHASVVLGRVYFFVETTKINSPIGLVVSVFCSTLSMVNVLCLLKLLFMQLVGIVKNMTRIEQCVVEKAHCRRLRSKRQLKPFVYPYNIGWYSNLGQVFNIVSQTRGKGIEFPVCKNCDQYTLTREQLAQKKELQKRTRTFECIRHFTGHWLNILSQGIMVAICAPKADDRISLEPNDLIKVTRIHDYWLYGERVLNEVEDHSKILQKETIRGWFPRRCAIDVTEMLKSGEPSLGEIAGNPKGIGKHKLNQD